MDPQFWHQRWEAGQIGFHQSTVHGYLQQCWQQLELQGDETVFVPLCGKTLDMLWLLQQGHSIIGVELSPIAVSNFFRENSLTPTISSEKHFSRYALDEITLLQGDYFALQATDLKDCKVVYDRAALIALPSQMRQDYVEHLRRIVAPDATILLVTLNYPQQQMSGPPFAVSAEEVRQLFADNYRITVLRDASILEQEPRFKAKGLDYLYESAYLLTAR